MKQCDNESIFVGCNGKIEGLLEVNQEFTSNWQKNAPLALLPNGAVLPKAIPHIWGSAITSAFFVRCNGKNRRFTGGKSGFYKQLTKNAPLTLLPNGAVLPKAIPHIWGSAITSAFFVRCNGKNRRFAGGKSRFLQAADGGKGIVSAAAEWCGVA